MENKNNIKEWRAGEIAKIFLLKSNYKLSIDDYPTPLFDFFVSLKTDPTVNFAVEVKNKIRFNNNLNAQLNKLKIYRNLDVINIPVLLFKIDERNEVGEIDFLVIPSFRESKLLIRNEFKFQPLNQNNLTDKIDTIIKWYKRKI